jgi:hypothetical protein
MPLVWQEAVAGFREVRGRWVANAATEQARRYPRAEACRVAADDALRLWRLP